MDDSTEQCIQSINRIRIFNVARITGVITKSTKAKSTCGQLQQNVLKWLVEQVYV